MERSLFSSKTQLRVRNYELDWQGIVHNATYLLYFEVGRIEYLRQIGYKLDLNAVRTASKVVLVRNEINYKSSAHFDEAIDVFSRISYIKDTSFGFEGFLEESGTKRLIAENLAVHVWLDPRTGEPRTVPEDFRKLVGDFEGDRVAIAAPRSFT